MRWSFRSHETSGDCTARHASDARLGTPGGRQTRDAGGCQAQQGRQGCQGWGRRDARPSTVQFRNFMIKLVKNCHSPPRSPLPTLIRVRALLNDLIKPYMARAVKLGLAAHLEVHSVSTAARLMLPSSRSIGTSFVRMAKHLMSGCSFWIFD